MNTNQAPNESSEELEAKVRATLDKTEQDVERIEETLTPGTFIDNAIFANRPRHPRETWSALSDNPIGTTLLALGTFMLSEREGVSGETILRDKAQDTADAARDLAYQAQAKVQDLKVRAETKVTELKDRADQKFVELKDRADQKFTAVKETADQKVGEFKDKTTTKFEEFKDITNTKIGEFKEKVGMSNADDPYSTSTSSSFAAAKDRVVEKVSSFSLRDVSPLTLATAGLGLGAMIGASLPEHEQEQQLVNKADVDFGSLRADVTAAMKASGDKVKNVLAEEMKALRWA
jgi:hypothetical protein